MPRSHRASPVRSPRCRLTTTMSSRPDKYSQRSTRATMRPPWLRPRRRSHATDRNSMRSAPPWLASRRSGQNNRPPLCRRAATLAFARAAARGYGNLATTGAGTMREHQEADSTLQQGQAALDSAEASLDAARRQLDVLKAQRSASEAAVKADEAQLEQARLNLSYTQIRAPVGRPGGERSVQGGNYVAPGSTLMTVVPLDQVYIEANYLEVELRHVRSGLPVTIHLDAYDIDLKGTVVNVPPASGTAFAPIAPNNATGNFTKIVQRLPVKIVVTPGQPLAKLLRVGLSVETTIHTGLEDVVDEQRRSSDRVTGH